MQQIIRSMLERMNVDVEMVESGQMACEMAGKSKGPPTT